MRIYNDTLLSVNSKKINIVSNNNDVNFKSFEPIKSIKISGSLKKNYEMECHFHSNGFVAECIEKVTKIFDELFGKSSLPSAVSYEKEYDEDIRASYYPDANKIIINKDLDKTWYDNMKSHKKAMKEDKHFIRPDWSSSRHPAQVFVHEYSHSAHWNHLVQRNGYDNAKKLLYGLRGVTVPTSIGRLIAKFKISEYAVDGLSMFEFMAERMTKDICKGLSGTDDWKKVKSIDVNYNDIYTRKWKHRYSTPQSYIDYFTQQVWNGDIVGAEQVGKDAGEYLARLEAPVAVPVETKAIAKVSLFAKIGNKLAEFGRKIVENSNQRNDLKLNI